jgi:hypothetical protein
MKPSTLLLTGVLLAPGTALAAFSVGGDAYTKRMETNLLASPSAVAQTVTKIPYGKKLRVQEIKGLWLRVKESKNEGWVFQGNLAEFEPKETAGIDIIPVSASSSSASNAARPLASGASDYADRRGINTARADVLWLEVETAKIGPDQVLEYMKQEGKGEFK